MHQDMSTFTTKMSLFQNFFFYLKSVFRVRNTNITPDFHILHRTQDFSSIIIEKLPFLTFVEYTLLLHNGTENKEYNLWTCQPASQPGTQPDEKNEEFFKTLKCHNTAPSGPILMKFFKV